MNDFTLKGFFEFYLKAIKGILKWVFILGLPIVFFMVLGSLSIMPGLVLVLFVLHITDKPY